MPIAWNNLYPPSDAEKAWIPNLFDGTIPVSIAAGNQHWLALYDAVSSNAAGAQPAIFQGMHGGAMGDAPHLTARVAGTNYHIYMAALRWRRGGNGAWVNGQRITVTVG